MANRSVPILLTIAHHVLALLYLAFHLRQSFPVTAHAAGQLFAFAWVATSLVLLFVRPNLGRWLSVVMFAVAASGGMLMLAYFLFQSVPALLLLPLLGFELLFFYLAYALAFGESTRVYIAQIAQRRV